MSMVGQREILTQRHVVQFFQDELEYGYLGNWKDRAANSNVEEERLATWLRWREHSDHLITKVLHELNKAKGLGGSRTLYEANRDVYELLRYGVKVQPDVGEQHVTVWLIDWEHPEENDFAIAEEVTILGHHTKRPDIVLYVNGIALGVLELKRSTVAVNEGIRQSLDSQNKAFIQPFYTTIQLLMAGNDTEGLRYGVIETPEKYWLSWREGASVVGERTGPSPSPFGRHSSADIDLRPMGSGLWPLGRAQVPPLRPSTPVQSALNPLDRALGHLCRKERLLEIVHDFMVFDAGIKKTCRHNQFFGVRAAREHVLSGEGGIIWHTQGSGKSLTMVWLAKWIREHVENGRVLIITDRTELDEQIERVFLGVKEEIYRTKDGADLVGVLNRSDEPLVASLIHKFGGAEGSAEEGDVDDFIESMQRHLPNGFCAKGNLFVFVDECHRTQSGKLHAAMKALLPDATLIGFTGTPLLKKDKQKSIEVFGPYIHTYKYDEAVRDKVVLDLRYEARDIDQNITSPARSDQWFEIKTRGLTDVAKAQLKQRWGTMQKVLSAQDRLEKIVADILLDMEIRPRLKSGHGNALLVSDSIYSACRFYEQFQRTDLAGKCAIVTSYKPNPANIKGEDSGEGMTERLLQYEVYREMLAAHFDEPADVAAGKVALFEQEVTKRFVDEPGQMKLLIVVDKLLTGFDAPSATYLYIDKQMRDHGLFQAICRVNRLDGVDKEYGYVVDYKDLFNSLEKSIRDYTGEAFDGYDAADVAGLLEDRLAKGRERLEEMRESIRALCEPVERPLDTLAYIRFFCGADNTADTTTLKENEPKRVALYERAAALLRAYANIANEMTEAGYTAAETTAIKDEVDHYEKVRQEVKLASGDYIDMKLYEPAMRHLLDTYIRAEESEKLSAFDEMTLVELIVERGPHAVDALPKPIRDEPAAVAETIENNIRRVIIDEMAVNPKHYERMSELLGALIEARKKGAMDYRVYLAQIAELAKQVSDPGERGTYPGAIDSPAKQALYDNLDRDESLAVRLDHIVRSVKKDDWRGNRFKEREVRLAIRDALDSYVVREEEIFELVKHQREY